MTDDRRKSAQYIVAWMTMLDGPPTDAWETYDTFEDAKCRYDSLIRQPEVYSVSVCKPVLSTDYVVHDNDQIET